MRKDKVLNTSLVQVNVQKQLVMFVTSKSQQILFIHTLKDIPRAGSAEHGH